MELGESEPIWGTGLALPHSGFSVLLQPRDPSVRKPARHRPAKGTAHARNDMGDTPFSMDPRLGRAGSEHGVEPRFPERMQSEGQCGFDRLEFSELLHFEVVRRRLRNQPCAGNGALVAE